MAIDPYASCPCGSGKKFKWCCQPIHGLIDKAFQQDAANQHDAALRTMDQLVAEHPANPEAWGRRADLLYRNNRLDDAETALQKAFEINPNYPFGFLLQGMFRLNEGEVAGALLLFRRAADAYAPEAHDQLAQVYALIAENELKMNRPVAARAALKLALHFQPASEELRQALDGYFGPESPLPPAARRDYLFLSPAQLAPERRADWEQALVRAATGKLSDAAKAFYFQTEADAANGAAWYNLGLTRAWLGDNRGALDAFDRYVAIEADEELAALAWTLGEVLRLGYGMEEFADTLESSVLLQIRDPDPISACLQEWQSQRRLLVIRATQEDGVFSALVLEKVTSLIGDSASGPAPHLGAYLMIVGDRVRLWHSQKAPLEKIRDELTQKVGPALAPGTTHTAVANFNDVLAEALVFPVGVADKDLAEQRVRQQQERFFEETWLQRPLKALGGVPPIDAAGSPVARKKLRGVVRFIEDIAAASGQPYDFDRLRRKVGLLAGAPATPTSGGPDIAALGSAELAALSAETLADDQLELAFQTALKLDARELAGHFARILIQRPESPARPDRYPVYNLLVQQAQAEGKPDVALEMIDLGEKFDADHNEGQRGGDYAVRRGQILAKRGEHQAAADVFARLIERVPSELKYRGSATEALLSAHQGALALPFAEGGLAKAREQNNRDSEQYFQELAAAARKQQ